MWRGGRVPLHSSTFPLPRPHLKNPASFSDFTISIENSRARVWEESSVNKWLALLAQRPEFDPQNFKRPGVMTHAYNPGRRRQADPLSASLVYLANTRLMNDPVGT